MKKALVIFSGGQDSTTCLAWAQDKFDKVLALTFDYGQRHEIELLQSSKVCKLAGVEQEFIKTDIFSRLSENALTHDVDIKNGTDKDLRLPEEARKNKGLVPSILRRSYRGQN